MLWFYQLNNRIYGPIAAEKLVKLKLLSEISLNTLCSPEDVCHWGEYQSFSELKQIEKKLLCYPKSKNDQWVVLRIEGAKKTQDGPYFQDELIVLYSQGKIDKTDFVWIEGSHEWIPIYRLAFLQDVKCELSLESLAHLKQVIESEEFGSF